MYYLVTLDVLAYSGLLFYYQPSFCTAPFVINYHGLKLVV